VNIIGFCEFHVGWSWLEYRLGRFEKLRPYEDDAKRAVLLNIDNDNVEPTKQGQIANERAKAFRKNHVHRFLNRLLLRKEVGVMLYDEYGDGSTLDDKLRFSSGTQLFIEESGFGFPDLRRACRIDAIHLTLLMAERRWRERRSKKYDWLNIERRVRNYFETYGCPKRKEDVYDAVMRQLSVDPPASELKVRMADLRAQYEYDADSDEGSIS
jgi:hypothetical protein